MTSRNDDVLTLLGGVLSRVGEVVGKGASYALFHYGAVEEGKRFGSDFDPDSTSKALARLDEILVQRSEVVQDESGRVGIIVRGSPLLGLQDPAMEGLVAGILEGVLTGVRGSRFKGTTVERRPADGGAVYLEFAEER